MSKWHDGTCEKHGKHGPLYICEDYSQELKAKILADSEKWKSNLKDPEWVKSQNMDAPTEAIMKAFAGVREFE